jgi:hypothetical protein
VRALLRAKADVNARTGDGRQKEIVQLLKAAGAVE